MKTKDFALKKIFDAMDEAGCPLDLRCGIFNRIRDLILTKENGSEIQLEYGTIRMREILTQGKKSALKAPRLKKEMLLNGLDVALTKYFQLPLDAVYSDTGNLKLLIINDKEHDSEKLYEQTKDLLTQHITLQPDWQILEKPKKEQKHACTGSCLSSVPLCTE